MTEQEIKEGNELIALFMGLHFHKVGWVDQYHIDGNYECERLDYDWSWEWLMPVIEKICRLKIGDGKEYVEYAYPRTFGMLNEETGQIMVRLNGFCLFEADTLIEATWLAVVDFIKFQNEK